MNCSKTEFILFGSKTQLSKCITTNISICGDLVKGVSVIQYLEAWLDQNLNFKEHVNKKCTTAMINLNKIRNIRRYLTTEATEVLVLRLVMSHLDYSDSILYGISKHQMQKMQRIQNVCAKLVLKKDKYSSSKGSFERIALVANISTY